MCTCICFIIFLVSKFVYLYSKTQSIGEYCDGEEEEGKENINLNCYQILNSWYVCLFIFPLVISIIITIFIVIWTHCVVSQFHLMFFIPIIIVTFQMCGIIVVESSWYFILFYLMMMMAMMMTMMIAMMMAMKVVMKLVHTTWPRCSWSQAPSTGQDPQQNLTSRTADCLCKSTSLLQR